MKGYTNSKGDISGEIVSINIIGVDNPTFVVSYDSIETTYTGNMILFIPDNVEYTITFNDVIQYITPNPVTYTAVKGNYRNIKVEYIYDSTIDLSMQDIYGNPIAQTTANCYVVNKPGKYRFPCVYGNMITNGEVNFEAATNNGGANSHDFVNAYGDEIAYLDINYDVYSCLHGNQSELSSVQLSIADTDNIFININLIDYSNNVAVTSKAVEFEVLSVPETGANGIISVKDASGTICWSWHIWIWPHDLTPVEITNKTGVKYNILPVNLATILDTADSINKTTGWKNWFYQFGRPTPLLCPSAYNSTSNHASYGALSYADASIASNIQTGIKNPVTFYKHSSSYNYNWFQTNSGKTYNLWDAACTSTGNSDNNVVKTIYDPSPIGFKMPNGNTFTGFSIINNANGIVKFTRYSGDSTGVGFPMSGYRLRTDGSLRNVGSDGYVWLSSAVSQSSAYYLDFDSSSVDPQDSSRRADGYSVRPVADEDIEVVEMLTIYLKYPDGTSAAEEMTAPKGVTLREFINSSYNTAGIYVDGSTVRLSQNLLIIITSGLDSELTGSNYTWIVREG